MQQPIVYSKRDIVKLGVSYMSILRYFCRQNQLSVTKASVTHNWDQKQKVKANLVNRKRLIRFRFILELSTPQLENLIAFHEQLHFHFGFFLFNRIGKTIDPKKEKQSLILDLVCENRMPENGKHDAGSAYCFTALH